MQPDFQQRDVHVGQLGDVLEERPYRGIRRRTLEACNATVAVYEFEPGAAFPLHRHPQEQITVVLHGAVEFVSPAGRVRLEQGGWSVVPPDVEHQLIAAKDGARVMAIVAPARAAGGYVVVE